MTAARRLQKSPTAEVEISESQAIYFCSKASLRKLEIKAEILGHYPGQNF